MRGLNVLVVYIVLHAKYDFFPSMANDRLLNVALYKPAFQSSVFEGNVADRGNDGRMDGKISSRNCMHTVFEKNSWWLVDLMDDYVIESLILTNRKGIVIFKI